MRPRRVTRPVVAITRNQYEGDAVIEAIKLLPVEQLFRPGDTVVVTPNWVNPSSPTTGEVTGPETLRQLLRFIKQQNPGRLVVAAGSASINTARVMREVGYERVINEEAVEFVDLNHGPFVEVPLAHPLLASTPVNQLLVELNVLISFTQIKMHMEATVSLGCKNIAIGWAPGEFHGFPKYDRGIHEDLHGFIASMLANIPVDLTILSGDQGMVGTGPYGGKAVNSDLVIAGTDPVATDTVGARLLGFLPQGIQYLWQLYRQGYGEADLQRVEIKGITLEEAERTFSMAAYGKEIIIDKERIMPPVMRAQPVG